MTTDANGNFTFSNLSLKLGIYSVRVVAPGASKVNTRLGGDHWDVVIGPNQIASTIGLVFGLSNFGG